jgi:hypothetical protein
MSRARSHSYSNCDEAEPGVAVEEELTITNRRSVKRLELRQLA